MELRNIRISKQLAAKDMVTVVQTIYPKYDKTLQSKCERGFEYGIQLRDDALAALRAHFTPEAKETVEAKNKPKGDGHKLTCRISCRLPDEEHAELQQYVKDDGYDTMQAWLAITVRRYIRRKRKALSIN